MKILITGAAGFIGSHLIQKLSEEGHELFGIDNLNNYYPVSLKIDRLANLGIETSEKKQNKALLSTKLEHFTFQLLDIEDKIALNELFTDNQFNLVINMAAQAGVRYSIDHPDTYIKSNLIGFYNILEACRNHSVNKLLFASSSSVYGNNKKVPFSESDNVDHPISLYAATKKSNELFAYTYAHLYGIKAVGLRFFTVYGPWGRPDMAYFKFTKAILNGESIPVYNNGNLERDFTYIDDIVDAIAIIIEHGIDKIGTYDILNIGNNRPVQLIEFIKTIEKRLGLKANMDLKPMQAGDVYRTYADISRLKDLVDYTPSTTLASGIDKFINWYMEYYS